MNFKVALFALLLAALPFSGFAQKSLSNTAPAQSQYGVRPNPGTHAGAEYGFWGMAPGMRMDHSLNVLKRDLNLTDSQAAQVRQLVESRKDKFEAIHQQAMPKFEHLMTLLRQPNPDTAAVGRATIELKQVHEQATAEQASLEKEFYNVLNPSQRAMVDKLRAQASDVLALHRLGLLAPEWMGTQQAYSFGE